MDFALQIALKGRQGKPSQNNGPTSPYFVHDCLVQNGQGKSVWWWAFLASCLGISVCVKHYLDFFPLYFHLGLPALGTDLKSRKGPYYSDTSSPIQNAPMQGKSSMVSSVLWALSLSLSDSEKFHPALP